MDNDILGVTVITSLAHTASTVLIGIIVGIVGYKLSSAYEFITYIVTLVILVGLGIIYLMIDNLDSHHYLEFDQSGSERSKFAIVSSLTTSMFFSPCLEIEAYYFTASALGW